MEVADSDLLFIDVDASTPAVKQELEEVSDYTSNAKSRVPSTEQVLYLIERLEKMPEIAKGCLRTFAGRQRARRIWDQMRLRLNSIEGTKKTSNQWMKYWTDKKKKVTSKAATGQAELTAIEEKILYLSVGGAKSRKNSESKVKADIPNEHFEPTNEHFDDDASQYSSEVQDVTFSGSRISPPIGQNNYSNPKSQTPPQQNQISQFDRILQVEERRLSMEQSNAQLMRTILEQSAQRERTILDAVKTLNERLSERNERDAVMAGALKTLGDGLLALSKAIKNNK